MSDERPLVDVVCAIVQKPNGEFLLAQRPVGKVYAGYWEFPGGKVDRGESLADATARELNEELGIDVQKSYPWLTRTFSYPHANVRLHFRRVVEWRNEPRSRENQAFTWQSISNINVTPLLPTIYGITHAENIGETAMLEKIRRALANGLRLIQVREKNWPRERLIAFAQQVIALARPFYAKVMLNGDGELAREAGADGLHLSSTALMKLIARPAIDLCGASCHNELELAKAAELNLDFVLLGPVLPTPSHPDSEVLGWQQFNDLVTNYPLPIYAIGGLTSSDQETAWQHGAHGIAMLRHAWMA
jgi:8-oxo-dGTP diphosphatase